jgi:hypothetical protein
MNLLPESGAPADREGMDTMRKVKQTEAVSDIYARLRELPMSDADRRLAIHALHQAELFVNAMQWMKEKLATAGQFFLKPSLKH